MASRLGSNASHPESDIETGGINVPQAKTAAAAGSPLRRGRWIRGNRRVLCAGPGGEPDTLVVVDVQPVDYHAESDRLPEHVAGQSAAPPRPGRAVPGIDTCRQWASSALACSEPGQAGEVQYCRPHCVRDLPHHLLVRARALVLRDRMVPYGSVELIFPDRASGSCWVYRRSNWVQ